MMNIADISSAKGQKFNLECSSPPTSFKEGSLVRVDATRRDCVFIVSQYGVGESAGPVTCFASKLTAEYLHELARGEECLAFRCLFSLNGVEDDVLVVQAYTFQSITEYKTPIEIAVTEELASQLPIDKISHSYIWGQLGNPALLCMNYKTAKRRSEGLRFIDGKRYLIADRTSRGIVATGTHYLRSKYDVPIDIFVAPQIRFVSESESMGENSLFMGDLDAISNPSSYFSRWDAYDRLSKKLSDSEAEEFGRQRYRLVSSRREQRGTKYVFATDSELNDEYIGRELGVPVPDSYHGQGGKATERLMGVGRVVSISGRELTTLKEYEDDTDFIPPSGDLKLNTTGDRVIIRRREAARDRMLRNQTPIPGLVSLIESGRSAYELPSAWGANAGITTELRRNFPRASTLNAEQSDALSLAINTPDIAVIQGPPGTGKTTVIKAICERYREIFERRERESAETDPDHRLLSPKILITSFQNEAVDNAISDPLPRDIPAYRKTSKRATDGRRKQYLRSLERWYNELRSSVSESVSSSVVHDYVERKSVLEDEFLSFKNAGEPTDKAKELIDKYLSFEDVPYPKDLVVAAKMISSGLFGNVNEDEEDPIVAKIEDQRTSIDEFGDGGARSARKLAAYIRMNDDLDISDAILKAIELVGEDNFTEDDFIAYVQAVDELKQMFCCSSEDVELENRERTNECILTLASFFADHYANTLSSLDDRKSIILYEFLEHLEQSYESLVEKYSMTTAATCQASMDLHEASDRIYDLVIVDEAARANPLDLFIPMSMGRKVILVGDQKQLPHMLEPDILNLLADELPDFNLSDIEKSLFERLFDMLSEGQRPKSVMLTRQYRMHPEICRFVSESFYDGLLETDSSVTADMKSCSPFINEGKPLAFIDVPITKGRETGGASKSRKCEVDAIGKGVKEILGTDKGRSVGVITFYSAQAKLIKDHLIGMLNDEERDYVEVGTVDAFQGREFDYVLLSCVRSNSPKDGSAPKVGFLEKPNRLCVAFSRAIRQLTVYGDSNTVCQTPCFSRLHEICREGGGYLGSY